MLRSSSSLVATTVAASLRASAVSVGAPTRVAAVAITARRIASSSTTSSSRTTSSSADLHRHHVTNGTGDAHTISSNNIRSRLYGNCGIVAGRVFTASFSSSSSSSDADAEAEAAAVEMFGEVDEDEDEVATKAETAHEVTDRDEVPLYTSAGDHQDDPADMSLEAMQAMMPNDLPHMQDRMDDLGPLNGTVGGKDTTLDGVDDIHDMERQIAEMNTVMKSKSFRKFLEGNRSMRDVTEQIMKLQGRVNELENDLDYSSLSPDANNGVADYAYTKKGKKIDLNHPRNYNPRRIPADTKPEHIKKARQATADLAEKAPSWPWPELMERPERMALLAKFQMSMESDVPIPEMYKRLQDRKPIYKTKLWVPLHPLNMTKPQQKIFIELIGQRYDEKKRTAAFVSRNKDSVEENEQEVFKFFRNSLMETLRLEKHFEAHPDLPQRDVRTY